MIDVAILQLGYSPTQGWHIGIGRYEISPDIAHIGKIDISVSVIIPADTLRLGYRPVLSADISVMTNHYR